MNKLWLLAPIVLAAYLFLGADSSKLSEPTVKINQLNGEIARLNAELRKSATGIELLPTIDYWQDLKNASERAGLKFTWNESPLHEGRFHSYSGILEGKSIMAIAILGKFHQQMPIEIHKFSMNEGIAKFYISVLGVDR